MANEIPRMGTLVRNYALSQRVRALIRDDYVMMHGEILVLTEKGLRVLLAAPRPPANPRRFNRDRERHQREQMKQIHWIKDAPWSKD